MAGRRAKNVYWRVCCVGVIVLCVLTFTPLVIPAGQSMPMLAGVPFTLWTGILIAWLLVALTLVGVYVHPKEEPTAPDER